MRKIIQISTSGVQENFQTQCELLMYALCDDGSVWEIDNRPKSIWHRVRPIPQGEAYE